MPARRKYTDQDRAKAAAAGVSMQTVYRRIADGMEREAALTTPPRAEGETGRKNSQNPLHPWGAGRFGKGLFTNRSAR